jgi:hypothetical protein
MASHLKTLETLILKASNKQAYYIVNYHYKMSFFVCESFKLTIRKDWRGKPAKIKIMPRHRHRHCISSSLRNDLRKTRETKQKKTV